MTWRHRLLSLVVLSVSACGGLSTQGGVVPELTSGEPLPSFQPPQIALQDTPDELVRRASLLLEHGQIAQAERLNQRALLRQPEHLGGRVVDARIGVARADLDRAWTRFDQALTQHARRGLIRFLLPEVVPVVTALSQSLREASRPVEALELITRLSSHLTDDMRHLVSQQRAALQRELDEIALSALRAGLQGRAEEALDLGRQYKPRESGEGAFARAQLEALRAPAPQVSASLRAWAEAEPGSRWSRVARFYEGGGALKPALEAYQAATASAPEDSGGWLGLARLCLSRQEVQCAQEAYGAAAACFESKSEQLRVLLKGARALRETAGNAHSIPLYEASLVVAPANWDVLSEAITILHRNRRHPALERAMERYVRASDAPDDALERALGRFLEFGLHQSVARVIRSLTDGPNSEWALSLAAAKALPHHRLHDAERSELLARFLDSADDERGARLQAAEIWTGVRRFDLALRHARRVQVLDSTHPKALVVVADALESQGDVQGGKAARRRLRSCAQDELRCAVVLSEEELKSAGPGRALNRLQSWSDRRNVTLSPEFHRVRYLAAMAAASQTPRMVEMALRAWLALSPPAERRSRIEDALVRIGGEPRLRHLRIELLQELESWTYLEDRSKRSLVRELQAEGRLIESVQVWRRIVEEAEEPHAANLEAGANLLKLGFDAASVSFFSEVDVRRIADERMHGLLAEMFLRRGQRERARVHHEAMLETSESAGDDVRLLKKVVRDLIAHREGARALEVNRRLLRRAPRDREALMSSVQISILLRDVEARSAAISALIKFSPQSSLSATWRSVGEALHAEGLLEEAIEAYTHALVGARRKQQDQDIKSISEICAEGGEPQRLLFIEQLLPSLSRPAEGALRLVEELESHGLFDEAAGVLSRALDHPDLSKMRSRFLFPAFESAAARGDMEAAEAWLSRHLSSSGTKPTARIAAARRWWALGESTRALQLLATASRLAPTHHALARVRAELLFRSGDQQGAEEVYVKALSDVPTGEELLNEVVSSVRASGMLDWLQTILTRGSATLQARPKRLLELARLALETGSSRAARAHITDYLGADRRGHAQVAQLARETDPALALRHYEWALSQPSVSEEAFPVAAFADLLVDQGRAPDRARRFSEIVRRSREPAQSMVDVARVLLERGAREEALEWLELADSRTNRPAIKLIRGHALMEMGEVERAAELFEGVTRARSIGVQRRRARWSRGNSNQLAADLHQIAQAFESRGEFLAGARLLARLGDTFGRSGAAPPYVLAHEAQLLLRAGEVERALQLLDRVQFPEEAHAGGPRVWTRLSAALVDRGLTQEAIDLLAKAMRHVRSSDLYHEHLRLLVRAGRGVAAWRAARIIMGTFKVHAATEIMEIALDGGLPGLARRIYERARKTSRPEHRELRDLLLARGAISEVSDEPSRPRSAELLLETASRAVASGDLSRAASLTLEALRLRPRHAGTQREALRLTAYAGTDRAFEEALDTVARIKRSRVGALALASQVLSSSGQVERALMVQRRAIELEPGEPTLVQTALISALDAGDRTVAQQLTARLVERWGDQDEIRLSAAETWLRYGGLELAAEIAQLDRPREGQRAWRAELLKAGVLDGQGRASEAIASLLEGVTSQSNSLSAYVQAFDTLERLGAGEGELTELLSRPDGPLVQAPAIRMLNLRLAWRTGDSSRSSSLLQGLLKDAVLTPSSVAEALFHAARLGKREPMSALLGELVAHIGAPEAHRVAGLRTLQALELASVGLGPELSPEVRSEMAVQSGRWLERGIGEAFLPGAGHVSAAGQAHELSGEVEASLWLYENHALQSPWDSTSRNNWSYALAQTERELPLALELIRRARSEQREPMASFLDTEAWVLHKLGRSSEARQMIEWAILHATDPRYQTPEGRLEMLYHHGEILRADGDIEGARRVLRACSARGPLLPYGARCERSLEAL